MKTKKVLFIVIINLLLCFFFLYLVDFIIYTYYKHNFYKTHPKNTILWKYAHNQWLPEYFLDFGSYFNGKSNIYFGRLPDGTEYNDRLPIVIFGCSYAFGEYLESYQTLSYKLAKQLQRPVYNRSIHGGSFQHLMLQTHSPDLYNKVPKSDTVIYVMMSDHYRRMFLNYFDILDYHIYPVFKVKKGELIITDYRNKIMNFIRTWYITKLINQITAKKYVENPLNADSLTDMALAFFLQSKYALTENYGENFKFYVLFYEETEIPYSDLLRKKLQDNGFIVYSTKELTSENLLDEKYFMKDKFHPSEAAWDLLTPLIIKKFQLQ